MDVSLPQVVHRARDPAFLAGEVARLWAKAWRRLGRVDRRLRTLEPVGKHRGDVLLSYIIDPFLLPPGTAAPHSHTHFWESFTMGRLLAEAGLRVDAISWTHQDFVPRRQYHAIIDVRSNLERLAPMLPDAIKVLHADTAHWHFHNAAQARRHAELEGRRGVRIRARKQLPRTRAIEAADIATLLGNRFTQETYAFAGTPLVRIPISVPFTYPWPAAKDWQLARHRFLWFGSGGLVHKGLDLVLEAFAAMPELHLTVCGPIRREADFERAYFRELYRTPNIDTVGWVDVRPGGRFETLARGIGALLYPTCSEGGGASVLSCMHASMVPIVPREASVDVVDAETGIVLADCSIASIQRTARAWAARSPARVERLARAAWHFARNHHTKAHFEAGYRRFAHDLVARIEGRTRIDD